MDDIGILRTRLGVESIASRGTVHELVTSDGRVIARRRRRAKTVCYFPIRCRSSVSQLSTTVS